MPTNDPSHMPSSSPSISPSAMPTNIPSHVPSTDPSILPSVIPTNSPSRVPSTDPSTLPSVIPTSSNQIICPNETADFDSENDDIVVVSFSYSLETESSINDPTNFLPDVEQTLLEKVAQSLLSHCIDNSDNRQLQSRSLQRRLAAIGISSDPNDEVLSSECVPQLDASNKCFLISGAVSVAKQSTDSSADITTSVRVITESVMAGNDLLSSEYNNVRRISYVENTSRIGETIVPVGKAQGSPEIGGIDIKNVFIIGSSIVAAALVLFGVGLVKRQRNLDEDEETSDTMFGTTMFPGLDVVKDDKGLDVIREENEEETDDNDDDDDLDELIMSTSLSTKISRYVGGTYDNCCNVIL
eukprot:scaffold530_cov223-Chaetoceros_neogracile.AAC.13